MPWSIILNVRTATYMSGGVDLTAPALHCIVHESSSTDR